MKYTLIIMIVLLIAPMSCYLNNKDDSRVTINLSTIPADVKVVHVAVYDGVVNDDNLLLVETFSPIKSVELSVPTGANRIFVVWGEGDKGLAVRCGASTPVTVDQGTSSVSVKMDPFSQTLFSLSYVGTGSPVTYNWNPISGATEYELQANSIGGFNTIYFGQKNTFNGPTYYYGERVKAYQSAFDLYSDWDNPL